MAILSELAESIAALTGRVSLDVEPHSLADALRALGDDVVEIVAAASVAKGVLDRIVTLGAAVIAERSTPDLGRAGLAAAQGHRSPAALVQSITGSSKSDAVRALRVGAALMKTTSAGGRSADEESGAAPRPWHAPADEALLAAILSATQHDAIVQGLGEPTDGGDEAWTLATERLVREARVRTVEELRLAARAIRDILDADGAQRRFDERFAQRAFRMWTDAGGTRRGSFVFDDEGFAWLSAVVNAALRPRRGAPRFVDAEERARAEALLADERTNEQLAYDLLIDTLRAGALADAEQVFGTRQAGVRIITVLRGAAEVGAAPVGSAGGGEGAAEPGEGAARVGEGAAGVGEGAAGTAKAGEGFWSAGVVEDERIVLPAWLVAQRACDAGASANAVDSEGNPLYLGREARLFTAKQKLALAMRDGGCRWRECDRPASYCEAHHCDEWARDAGRTDVDRGILLCRFHHMQLHHGGWRITRDPRGVFELHSPDGSGPIELPPRTMLKYLWGDVDPPPPRFRPAA